MANGSIKLRGDRWRARYRDDAGKEHQQTFDKQRAAQRWLRKQLEALDAGKWVDPRAGKITLQKYFDQLAERMVWEDGTHKAMSLAVRSATFSDIELRKIRTTHVEAWVKTMSTTLAPGTTKTRFVNVRSVLRAAIRDKMIAADPTEGVRLPRQRKREASMTIPTPEEVKALLGAADERFTAFVAVAAFAGLRLGEIAALQVDDVEFLKRELHVERQVQRAGAGKVEIRPPKYGSERTIAIPDELLKILSAHVALDHRGEWLFAGASDDPPHQNTVGYWWRKTRTAASLDAVKLHDMRHFYASGLIAAGCDVVTVQRALGHASATTTLNTYSHLWPSAEDRTRKAAATLAEEVLSAGAGNMRAEGGD